MTQECEVQVEGNIYTVTVSDEEQVLLAAKAAGRAIVGLLHGKGNQNLSAAEYLVENLETADDQYLERVVRRHLGLPWIIAETDRLIVREFTLEDDILTEASVFSSSSELEAYIRHQYRFYEYGLWAVIRKPDHVLLGMAGISDSDMQLELGYHIFKEYQKQGYGVEACRIILDYVREELGSPVYAVTNPANERSVRLLEKLGFDFIEQRYNAEKQLQCLYGWNC